MSVSNISHRENLVPVLETMLFGARHLVVSEKFSNLWSSAAFLEGARSDLESAKKYATIEKASALLFCVLTVGAIAGLIFLVSYGAINNWDPIRYALTGSMMYLLLVLGSSLLALKAGYFSHRQSISPTNCSKVISTALRILFPPALSYLVFTKVSRLEKEEEFCQEKVNKDVVDLVADSPNAEQSYDLEIANRQNILQARKDVPNLPKSPYEASLQKEINDLSNAKTSFQKLKNYSDNLQACIQRD